MSSIMDLSRYYMIEAGRDTSSFSTTKHDNTSLDMTDFLSLMVAQLQNQSIDNAADTSDMLNQMVQMQMITALTDVTEAVNMMYSSSMIGKEVTIAQYNNGQYEEIVGTVSATGTSSGEQVIFVNDEMYYMSDILAIGRLPGITAAEDAEADAETDDDLKVEDKADAAEKSEKPEKADADDKAETDTKVDGADADVEQAEAAGDNGADVKNEADAADAVAEEPGDYEEIPLEDVTGAAAV